MGEAATTFLLRQLGFQAPLMVVYAFALLLAVVYMNRAPLPAILTLVGAGVLGLTAFVTLAIQASLIESRPADFARLSNIVGIAGSCFRAIGLGALVGAIFVGRNEPPQDRNSFDFRQ